MNRLIVRLLGLTILASFLLIGLKQEAHAQQGQDRQPIPDQLSSLTSYQGLEEMPRVEGGEPAPENLSPVATTVNVPYSQIVFQSYRNENDWNIFLADGSGGNQAQLTSDASADIHPRLNHGCTRIAFASKRSGNYEIYTMNPDGTGLAQLTQNSYDDVYPAWSYDGSLIAFQSYRDSDPEIYIMNADGTNQTRLTDSPGYDQMPTWSPDGRIAFSSERGGGYRIWVMNRDGSGLVQLSSQAYSMYPAWSPDGSQIAYSADNDGDDWLEMWLMNADGSNQRQLYDPGNQRDAWVRSWSPEGQYIAFTQISFIYYQEKWYWTYAFLHAWDTKIRIEVEITPYGFEWHPDWQTTDGLPPTSSTTALPAQSPAPFTVSWSGSDQGPSGLKNFDVQVKDGAGGTWTDWQMAMQATSASYPGVGGHTYFFRARARDNAWNLEAWPPEYDVVTTVESLAPVAFIKPLPLYMRNGSSIEWSGRDPGDSGIMAFDIQFKDISSENWINWVTGSQEFSEHFTGTAGHTYAFRGRAVDNAQNLGSWSSINEDTSTTFYSWRVAGETRDNTGVPAAQVNLSVLPDALAVFPSNREGVFAAYAASNTDSYQVTWDKDGYNDLPSTGYLSIQDARVGMVLPPIDNTIPNWGFENSNLLPDWLPSGSVPPTITSGINASAVHSGNYGAQLGKAILPGLYGPVSIANNIQQSPFTSDAVVDRWGYIHVVWTDAATSHVYYKQRILDGSWTNIPVDISGPNGGIEVKVIVDSIGNVHVVWSSNTGFYYTKRETNGVWLSSRNIANSSYPTFQPVLTLTPDDTLHVGWIVAGNGNPYYANRDVRGNWSEPIIFCMYCPGGGYTLVGDKNGVVHGLKGLYYLRREPDGTWLDKVNIYPDPNYYANEIQLLVDSYNIPHVIWTLDVTFYHTQRNVDGSWTTADIISSGSYNNMVRMEISQTGELYATWCQNNIYRIRIRDGEGNWSAVQDIPGINCHNSGPKPVSTTLDDRQNLHLAMAWNEVQYTYRNENGLWATPQTFTGNVDPGYLLKITGIEGMHLFWMSGYGGSILYAGPGVMEETADSILSQVTTVPMSMTNPVLSILYHLDGHEITRGSWLSLQIKDNLTTTTVLSVENSTNSWMHAWFDLTPWLSQTITLTFHVHQTEGYYPLWAYLDEVTVGSAHPDAWVSVSGSRAALPGDQVALRLTYGNRSPAVEALSSTITATLPSGLVFASASLTPTLDGNVLTWSAGDLPPGSGPSTIWITATVTDDAALGSTLTLPVEIASLTPELEQANNRYEYALFIGRMVFLPLTQR